MGYELTEFDKECLESSVDIAKETFRGGHFPVGAVLVIDNQIIDTAGRSKESWVAHAENSLIIKNAIKIQEARKNNKTVKIYSSLEPCIQCLGASVNNRVNEIFFIQKDPLGGACNLNPDTIGLWYKEHWPNIHHCLISDEPRKLLFDYCFEKMKSDTTGWYKKCYEFYSKTQA